MTLPQQGTGDYPSAVQDIRLVSIILACGAVNSMNIAKLAPTVQTLQASFGLSLSEVGLLASLFATLIVLSAMMLASAVRVIGARRILLLAMAIAASGTAISLIGQTVAGLFIGRMIEGISLIAIMLTGPSILSQHTHPIRRGAIMGVWGGFMPLGNAVALLFAPLLLDMGSWQAVWQAGLWVTLVVLALAFLLIPKDPEQAENTLQLDAFLSAIRNKIVGILGIVFAAHSLVYQALVQLMPVFNQSIVGLSLPWASYFTVIFCLLNFAGNILCGQLLQRNWRPARLVLLTGTGMTALLVMVVTFSSLPVYFLLILLLFGMISGGIPPVCFYVISRQKTAPANIPILTAWMFQIEGLGLLLGPVYFTFLVERSDSWIIGTTALIPFTLLMMTLAHPIQIDED